MTKEKQGGDIERVFQDAKIIWKNTEEALEKGNYVVAATHLIALSGKIGEVIPELAPVLGAVIESYGAAAKPLFDQFFTSGTKTAAYFYEQLAEVKKNLLPEMKKYEEAKAQFYAMKRKALQAAGFKRAEAMDIILAEICGVKSSKKMADFSSLVPKKTKKINY